MARQTHRPASLQLPDGRGIDYQIRTSDRARSLRLKISARDGLVVTVPFGIDPGQVVALVASKAGWIARHLAEVDSASHRMADARPSRPETFDLDALSESWRVVYRESSSRTVRARTEHPGQVLVTGAVAGIDACQAALRGWLARHAKAAFDPWLIQVAQETGLDFSHLSVRNQHGRWGSCSSRGRVSLNCKLLFLPSDQVRYVMIHELCHTLEPNHSSRFWALVRGFEPRLDDLRAEMRHAWKRIPVWAERVPASPQPAR